MRRINIGRLRLDFQPPECLIEETVQGLMLRIAHSHSIAPILVRFDGESYFVQDGFHRVEAARRCGVLEIDSEVLPGGLQDMEAEFRKMLDVVKQNLRADR